MTVDANSSNDSGVSPQLDAALDAFFGSPEASITPEAPEVVGSESSEAPEAKVEAPEVPEQRPNETDSAFEARLEKTLQKLQETEKQSLRHKKEAQEVRAKLQELESKFSKVKDPFEALKLSGYDYDKLTKAILAGEITPAQESNIPPELQAQLDEIKEFKAQVEKEKREIAQAKQREQHLSLVTKTAQELADSLPFASALSWVAERALDNIYHEFEQTGVEMPLNEALKKFDDAITNDATQLLTNERSLKRLLSDPKIRAAVTKVLGIEQQTEPPSSKGKPSPKAKTEGPSALSSNVTSIVPQRSEGLTDKERLSKAIEAADQVFGRSKVR